MDTLFKYKNIDQISWDLNLVCETPHETLSFFCTSAFFSVGKFPPFLIMWVYWNDYNIH